MLPNTAGVMSPEFMFAKRCINLINNAIHSNNHIVKTIFGIGISSCHSIIGANVRDLQARFDMKANNVENNWNSHYW